MKFNELVESLLKEGKVVELWGIDPYDKSSVKWVEAKWSVGRGDGVFYKEKILWDVFQKIFEKCEAFLLKQEGNNNDVRMTFFAYDPDTDLFFMGLDNFDSETNGEQEDYWWKLLKIGVDAWDISVVFSVHALLDLDSIHRKIYGKIQRKNLVTISSGVLKEGLEDRYMLPSNNITRYVDPLEQQNDPSYALRLRNKGNAFKAKSALEKAKIDFEFITVKGHFWEFYVNKLEHLLKAVKIIDKTIDESKERDWSVTAVVYGIR